MDRRSASFTVIIIYERYTFTCQHRNELLSTRSALKPTSMAVEDFRRFAVSPEDGRGPLILGKWKRSVPYADTDFVYDDRDDPHVKRKLNILKAHPEIQSLEGQEPWTIPITILAVAVNLLMAYYWSCVWKFSLVPFLLSVYFVGGTMTNIIGAMLHEATHDLIHHNVFFNKVMLFIGNIIIPIPVGASFRRYHREHHTFQGNSIMMGDSEVII